MTTGKGRHGAQKRVRRASAYAMLFALACVVTPNLGSAQDAQQRQSAADAYDRGSAAYLAEDYAAAARWFETANRLAPAAPALLQAIRAHRLAGDEARAATLALKMIAEYEGAAAEEAQIVVDALAPSYFRVNVECDGCAVNVDDSLAPHSSFFVSPGETHRVELGFATGDVEREVEGAAGDETLLEAVAPPRAAGSQAVRRGNGGAVVQPPPPDDGGGLSPALFVTSLVLTVGAGATLLWSGVDVNNDNAVYEQTVRDGDIATARTLLANGQKEETRTNALIGVTAGLAALTVVFAILTDWGGSAESEDQAVRVRPNAMVGARQGAVGLEGSF